MIIIDCVQGTEEWKEARLGIPTASQAHKIITPKNLGPSSQAGPYAATLIAELEIGYPLDDAYSKYMERGNDQEMEAVSWYEFEHPEHRVDRVGFCTSDDGAYGCSPDGLVGTDGGLEIKIPGAANHMAYWLDRPFFYNKYRLQVQFALWLTGRAWWHLVSYNPDLQAVVIRVEPEPAVHEALAPEVENLVAMVAEGRAKYQEAA